ncbi:hypothetical protein [Streptosporangium sp. NPDC000396]|uniref:hypothetical protein n=1 Tax=Streptosporangium sp. NPDC000396 TaxID=3366185 RepID=UPI00367CBD42
MQRFDADKAYTSQANRAYLRRRGINRLERRRAVATRYGKLAVRHEAAILVAAINEWL